MVHVLVIEDQSDTQTLDLRVEQTLHGRKRRHRAKMIVEAHAGEITFTSTPGKGTIFNFRLPLI